MSKEQFLQSFQKHLRVAEPKRSEILKEIRQHTAELGAQQLPVSALGSPWALAERLNRTHIGWWGTTIGLYLAPIVAIGLYLAARYVLMLLPHDPSAPVPWYAPLLYFFRFLPPLIGAMMAGQALGRSHRAFPGAPLLVIIAGLTLWATGAFGYRPEIGDSANEIGLFNLLLVFLQLIFLCFVGGLAFFMERPRKKKVA